MEYQIVSPSKLFQKRLGYLNFDIYYEDFEFIINRKEIFRTNKVIADMISPKISNIHKTDPQMDIFYLTISAPGNFKLIFELLNEDKILTESEALFVLEVLTQLGCTNNLDILPQFAEKVDENTVFALIQQKSQYSQFDEITMKTEFDYLAQNFYKLHTNQEIYSLTANQLKSILLNPLLCVDNENSLLEFVLEFIKTKKAAMKNPISSESKIEELNELFQCIQFSQLSKNAIQNFINHFDSNYLSHDMWASISKRLLLSLSSDDINVEREKLQSRYHKYDILYVKGHEFDGIISFLLKEHQNMPMNTFIEVKSSSIEREDLKYKPENALIMNEDSRFSTNNVPNSNFTIYFPRNIITVTHYSLRNSSHTFCCLKSWIIEASKDGKNWIEIDREENDENLHQNSFHVFETKINVTAKYIRLTQIDTNWNNNSHLTFACIELFGAINSDD